MNKTWEFLFGLRNKGSKFGIERMRMLVDLIGNPQDEFRIIHVAGTNGKGSVCAMLDSIYREKHYVTGLFTSPHLIDLGERIRVGGAMISEAQIEKWVNWLMPKAQEVEKKYKLGYPTFFEFITAVAFLYFREKNIDVAIIETGLGGRLDSTNVVKPDLSVITSISKDHCNILGNTVEEIAREKAGIIKPNTPVLSGFLPDCVFKVISEIAKKKYAPIYYLDDEKNDHIPETNLVGNYQKKNAALAKRAIEILEKKIPVGLDSIIRGLRRVKLIGRWQIIENPCRIILDACHNEAGAICLKENLLNLKEKPEIWVGVLGSERAPHIMKVISQFASSIKLFEIDQPRACSADFLKSHVCNSFSGEIIDFEIEKVKNYISNYDSSKTILVTGSIYLIGQILGILKSRRALDLNDLF